MATSAKRPRGRIAEALIHDSAVLHVTGEARYTDDLPEPEGLLHAAFGLSPVARGRLKALDLTAVAAAPGVIDVVTAADVIGANSVGPVIADEPILAERDLEFAGQAVFAVAAETVEQARRAVRLARFEIDELKPILTVDEAMAAKSFVLPPHQMKRGDTAKALARARHRLKGRIRVGGQDHFYLEGQIGLAIPGEDGDMVIYSSTQHPTELQHLVAHSLGQANHTITTEVRRMGGAFGGKETQAVLFACIAALLARRTGRAVKARADRDDDMVMTGKRHDFRIDYDVGFDDSGRIKGYDVVLAARCGISADLSSAICDRAMFHADNAYYLPAATITSHRCRTNTVSNTAFRGFGGPQGMMGIETVVDEIARHLGLDPLTVRRRNLYGDKGRSITPYYMTVEDNILPEMLDDLEKSADYHARRDAIRAFNATSPVLKKGLALTPVRFGISFTTIHLNQGGALIHVYADGSVALNHGGTEMGQGLNTKVAQVVAEAFQIDVDRIRITATNTGKVPNTSATAASSGSDLNGAAARAAALTIKRRLARFIAGQWGVRPGEVTFENNRVHAGPKRISFAALARQAYFGRVQLSATGFYRTPKIFYDRDKARGRPFLYFAYGAAVSEVIVDTLTGETRLTRADLLHDCGTSINPALDRGQIEGGFVQGMGWLTSEELYWTPDGAFASHAPSTYKIPTSGDVPADFRVRLLAGGRNRERTVHRSKAVGEPPLMLAISVFLAIKDAIAAVGEGRLSPRLDTPATPERVLFAVQELRQRLGRGAPEIDRAEAAD